MDRSKLGDLLEAAPDAMIVVDPRGRIVVVHARTEKVFAVGRQGVEAA